MKKILHICNDNLFIAFGKKIFDSVINLENEYWINTSKKNFEYVKFDANQLTSEQISSPRFLQRINASDLLCIHFLNENLYDVLYSGKIKIPVLWIGWGGDYYWMIDTYPHFQILLPKTTAFIQKFPLPTWSTKLIQKIKKFKHEEKFKIVNKIDYFSPAFEEDFSLIKKNYPGFKPTYIDWNYGYLNAETIAKYEKLRFHGKKVMIGNSATPTNNHLDIFDLCADILQNRELIIPLNYGSEDYAKTIAHSAKKLFGSQLEILEELLPAAEFDAKLMECQNLILGNIRQQAIGTMITAMYMGINIFVFEKSINYRYFKKQGFHLYTIEQLIQQPELLDSQLDEEKVQFNRQKINYLWSIEKNRDTIADLLDTLNTV